MTETEIATSSAPAKEEPQQTLAPVMPPGAGAKPITIVNVRLEDFERAVLERRGEDAGQLLMTALRRIKQGAEFIGYPADARLKPHLYTRLTTAILYLFMDKQFQLSQDGFDLFASEHAIIDVAFRASLHGSSDHGLGWAATNVEEVDRNKMKFGDGSALIKFLLTYSMRSGFTLNFRETFVRSPQQLFCLWAGMISPLITTSVVAMERREELLGLHELFSDVRASDAVLPTLSDAYMYTSYGLRADKHEAKATISRILARRVSEMPDALPSKKQLARRRHRGLQIDKSGGKPTVLVCCEWFTSHHAMFRCYAPIIRQLRGRFRLVGMCRESDIDDAGRAEFDEFIPVPMADIRIDRLAQRINGLAPDIIFYPSIGMAMWWVALSSVRLAPIQCMGLGHPASSRSRAMDYVICEAGAVHDQALFSERIVTMPDSSARYLMWPGITIPKPARQVMAERVRVAVPAMVCKLNAVFMLTLKQIGEKARRPVEWHLFPNMIGLNAYQAAREIRDWLPDAVVHDRAAYDVYLDRLAHCDLHLCTFPFGGTNSNIDSMLLGIPIVCKEGAEPHERFDAMMCRHAGLPEFCIAKSIDEYIQAAVDLIDSNDLRQSLSRQLLAADLRGLFYGDPPPDRRDAFARAMGFVFERHEAMQDSEQRIWHIEPKEAA